jgi:hypothetical protein
MDTKRTKITCNRYGITKAITDLGFEEDQFHAVELIFGYGSNYDTEKWEFKLCEECIVEYVKTFKHQPNKKTYL